MRRRSSPNRRAAVRIECMWACCTPGRGKGVRSKGQGARIIGTCDTCSLPLTIHPSSIRHGLLLALAAALAATATLSAQVDERVMYASVVNRDGVPVLDLTINDFIVREDGQTREILRVARDSDP